MQRSPSKARGLQSLLVVLKGECFKKKLVQPSLGASRPAYRGWSGVAHHLDEFHPIIQEAVVQEVAEVRVCAGGTQGMQVQRAWFKFCSMTAGAFTVP